MNVYLLISVLASMLAALNIALFNRNSKAHSLRICVFAYGLTVYYGLMAIRLLMGLTPASGPMTFLLLVSGVYFCMKRGNVSDLLAALIWPIRKLLNHRYFKNGIHAGFTLDLRDTAVSEKAISDLLEAIKKSKDTNHYKSLVVYVPDDRILNKEPHIEHLSPALPTLQPERIHRQRQSQGAKNRQQPARRAQKQRGPHLPAARKNPSNTRKQSPHYY
ncbi:phage holin family protein [Iodobacter ciconiae]|uniref:Uncharacterized protein n=1 Tax=Iodobacter ciconiae TaxID=2496266 RepID=A0A3S8ZPY6_9NEIS|nr:phage holin family protein [Iodobacter ciconiae]AZN35536.1 hypothetical protein EJO50_02955 [Iodobacter ciconiae]